MRRIMAGAALALSFAAQAGAATISDRADLAERIARLTPVYGERNSFGAEGTLLPSADLTNGPYGRMRIIGLSGVIGEGDVARLADALGPDGQIAPFFLVLESPGGSFLEGIRLGEFLQVFREGNGDPLLNGVLVLDGTECLSACAVAFALAALPRDSGESVRYVERGARLGFHMPFVPVDQQNRQTEIARAMDLTYEVMQEYMSLIGNGIAPTALVRNALHYRRPEDFFALRGGAITRFMDFVPVVGPEGGTALSLASLTQRDAINMCQQLAWSAGRDWVAAGYEFWPSIASARTPDDTPLNALFDAAGADELALPNCQIARLDGGRLGISSVARECPENAEPGFWCALEPDMFGVSAPPAIGALLGDSLGCHLGQMTQTFYDWDWDNAFLEEEDPARYRYDGLDDPDWPLQRLDWSGATLASNVNLRTEPGGDRLAQLDAGTAVSVSDCRLSADGQGVWYRVVAGGQDGWVSARYVSVPALEDPYLMARPAGLE